MGLVSLQSGAIAISSVVVCLAMASMSYGATFTEQFNTFSTDYHIQVAPDGQEAKIVLDQVAGKKFHLALNVAMFASYKLQVAASHSF